MKTFHAIKRLLDIFLKKILVFLINLISHTQSSRSVLQITLTIIIKGVGSNESRHLEYCKNVKALNNALKNGADVWSDEDIFVHDRRNWLLKNFDSFIPPDTRIIECCYSQTIKRDGEEDNAENSVNKENSDCDEKEQKFEDVDSFEDISLYEKASDAYSRAPQKRRSTAHTPKDFAKRRRGECYEESNLESVTEITDTAENTEDEKLAQGSSSAQFRDSEVTKLCSFQYDLTLDTTPSQYDNRISDSTQISKDAQLLDMQLSSEMSQSVDFNEKESNTNQAALPEKHNENKISKSEASCELTLSSTNPMNIGIGVAQGTPKDSLDNAESSSKHTYGKSMYDNNISINNTGNKDMSSAQQLPVETSETTDKIPCSETPSIGTTRTAGDLTIKIENVRSQTKIVDMKLESIRDSFNNKAMTNFADLTSKLDDTRGLMAASVPSLESYPNESLGIYSNGIQNRILNILPTGHAVGPLENPRENVDSKIPYFWRTPHFLYPPIPEGAYSLNNLPGLISDISSDSFAGSKYRTEMDDENKTTPDRHPRLKHSPGMAPDPTNVKKDARFQKKFYRQQRENRERMKAEGSEVHEESHPTVFNIPKPSHENNAVMNEIPNYSLTPHILRPFMHKLQLANKSPLDLKILKNFLESASATGGNLSLNAPFCYSSESIDNNNAENFAKLHQLALISSSSPKPLLDDKSCYNTSIRFWFEYSRPPYGIYCRNILENRIGQLDISLEPFFEIKSEMFCSESEEISVEEYLQKLRDLQKLHCEIMFEGFQMFNKYSIELITCNIPMRYESSPNNYNMHQDISDNSSRAFESMMENSTQENNLTVFSRSTLKPDLATDITSDNLNIGGCSRTVEENLHTSEYADSKTCTSRNTGENPADEAFHTISEKGSNYSSGNNCNFGNHKESCED